MDKNLYHLIVSSEIGKELFNFNKIASDVTIWTGGKQYNGISWLYVSNEQKYSLIGIDNDGDVYAIDDEGFLVEVCKGVENIPYEMLRVWAGFTENEQTEDIFLERPDIKNLLNQYENWAKENNIELDKNKIYHNQNGNLFNEYFDKE